MYSVPRCSGRRASKPPGGQKIRNCKIKFPSGVSARMSIRPIFKEWGTEANDMKPRRSSKKANSPQGGAKLIRKTRIYMGREWVASCGITIFLHQQKHLWPTFILEAITDSARSHKQAGPNTQNPMKSCFHLLPRKPRSHNSWGYLGLYMWLNHRPHKSLK